MIIRNNKKIGALVGLVGISVLFIAFSLLAGSIPALQQNPRILKKLHAWLQGARFISAEGVILQSHSNDCGPASLKMVLAAHGIHPLITDLAANFELNAKGTSMMHLRMVSTQWGVPARSWHIRPKDLPRLPLPAIAFVKKDHFVVIRRFVAPEVLEVDDPALGKLHWPARSFQKIWSGEMLVFDPAWTPL
jgi:predicted double-glycine peptidase